MGECDTPEIWGSAPLNDKKGSGQHVGKGTVIPVFISPYGAYFSYPLKKAGYRLLSLGKQIKNQELAEKRSNFTQFSFISSPILLYSRCSPFYSGKDRKGDGYIFQKAFT